MHQQRDSEDRSGHHLLRRQALASPPAHPPLETRTLTKRLRPGRGAPAFTLHDVLVAVTIATILAGAFLRPLARWHLRSLARAAAATLRADLARGRVHGVLRGETVTVVLDTVADAWRIEDGEGAVLFDRRLDSGLSLVSTAHEGRIPFTSRGTSNLYSTTWIVVTDDPDAPWRGARVSPTGAVEPR